MTRASSDRASRNRKTALRNLARENHDEYMDFYRQELEKEPEGRRSTETARKGARNRAWTRLRHRHEDRYQQLYYEACDQVTTVPAEVRSKAWQRATKRLQYAEQKQFRQLLGPRRTSWNERRVRALVKLREQEKELFDRFYQEEVEHLMSKLEKGGYADVG